MVKRSRADLRPRRAFRMIRRAALERPSVPLTFPDHDVLEPLAWSSPVTAVDVVPQAQLDHLCPFDLSDGGRAGVARHLGSSESPSMPIAARCLLAVVAALIVGFGLRYYDANRGAEWEVSPAQIASAKAARASS